MYIQDSLGNQDLGLSFGQDLDAGPILGSRTTASDVPSYSPIMAHALRASRQLPRIILVPVTAGRAGKEVCQRLSKVERGVGRTLCEEECKTSYVNTRTPVLAHTRSQYTDVRYWVSDRRGRGSGRDRAAETSTSTKHRTNATPLLATQVVVSYTHS